MQIGFETGQQGRRIGAADIEPALGRGRLTAEEVEPDLARSGSEQTGEQEVGLDRAEDNPGSIPLALRVRLPVVARRRAAGGLGRPRSAEGNEDGESPSRFAGDFRREFASITVAGSVGPNG